MSDVKFIRFLNDTNMIFNTDVNIVIAGEAGQGIETAAEVATKLLHYNNFNAFSIPEYMSRIRGGSNSSLIKISSEKSPCFSKRIDILFALDNKAFEHLKYRITPNTISLTLEKKNFYVVGYIAAIFKLNLENSLEFLKNNLGKYFVKTPEAPTQDKNILDFQEGFSDGEKNADIEINISPNKSPEDNMLISVNDAFGIGCIAGGCNFIAFYPMSPSTFLQLFLITQADVFGIVSKQVEDEICVINMALGANYAGARAIACTSGGGFDLMQEGVSLAGITESPVVINIAQRPGPATGLPTRTEQGDLNLALYSGHGEFPRIVYAPANIEDAYEIGKIAFDSADKFQVPVFVLTDQALLESTYSAKEFAPLQINEKHIVESTADYKRYRLSEHPISPRAIPDFGTGLVCVDSDEHDENGYITEDFTVRHQMTEKRLNKLVLIEKEVLEPYFVGEDDYKSLIISWGSNFNVIKEAIKDKNDFALLHFVQVYPISKEIFGYARKAERLIIIEQNATGQFEKLIRHEFGINFNDKFFKFDGEPFAVEEVASFLEKIDEV